MPTHESPSHSSGSTGLTRGLPSLRTVTTSTTPGPVKFWAPMLASAGCWVSRSRQP